MTSSDVRSGLRALGWVMALTGASVILQEQASAALLSTVVGADGPAGAIVIGVFFLGLALGGLVGAGQAGRARDPRRLCVVLAAFIGGWSLCIAFSFPLFQSVSSQAITRLGETGGASLLAVRLVISTFWILPASVAAGASFPALLALLPRRLIGSRTRLIPRMYALDLLGSALGAGLGCFWLFPTLGLTGTLLVVSLLQAAACALLLRSARAVPVLRPPLAREPGIDTFRSWREVPVAGAFWSGFCFFGFEVLWMHLVGSVIGSSVYAFGTVLTVVVAGLAGASAIISSRRLSRGAGRSGGAFAFLVASGALAATFPLWPRAPALLAHWGEGLGSFASSELLRFALALALLGIPALALGLVYPILLAKAGSLAALPARAAGVLQAFNAIGCVLGALVTGFLLIPALGSQQSYRSLTILLAVCGLATLVGERRRGGSKKFSAFLSMALVAVGLALPSWSLLSLTSGLSIYFRPLWVTPESRLLFFGEDLASGITTVVENPAGEGAPADRVRVLLSNGKLQGDDRSNRSPQVILGLLPLFHQERRDRALLIGMGTGQTAHVLAAVGFRRLDVAEISPRVVEASVRFFTPIHHNVLRLPSVRLFREDGRSVLLRTRGPYDVIVVQVNSAWFAGASNVYSREFYRLARSRMASDGVLEQWFPLHHVTWVDVASAISTLREAFPHVSMWRMGPGAYLMASGNRLLPDPAAPQKLEAIPALSPDLRELEKALAVPASQLGRFLFLDEEATARLLERGRQNGVAPTTDSNRRVEYILPRRNVGQAEDIDLLVEKLLRFSLDENSSRNPVP